jgi:hypothetical protein
MIWLPCWHFVAYVVGVTMKKVLSLVVLLTAVGCWADSLQIGPGTGTDPVVLSSTTSFTVLNNPGTSDADIATLILFFSVPTNLVGTLSVSGSNIPLTLLTSFLLTSSGCGDVYTCAGAPFSGSTNSDSFTNFTAGAIAAGLPAPTSYTVFEYSDGPIAHKQILTFTGFVLPAGTYIDGGGLQANGKEGFTAFTNTGLVATTTTGVPEPSSLMTLAAGLCGLGLFARRRLRL